MDLLPTSCFTKAGFKGALRVK